MKQSNRDRNLAHDAQQQNRVRPKPVEYDFAALDAVLRRPALGGGDPAAHVRTQGDQK